jgi:hypothetical protein
MLKKKLQAYILHKGNLHNKVLSFLPGQEIRVSENIISSHLQEFAGEGRITKAIKVHDGTLSHSFNKVYYPTDNVCSQDIYAGIQVR